MQPAGLLQEQELLHKGSFSSSMPDITMLQTIPLFSDLAEVEIEELARLLVEKSFPKGSEITEVGDAGDAFYIIQEGEVELSLKDTEGRYVPLDQIDAGEFFGELVMLTGESRRSTAKALTNVKVLELDREAFYGFLKRYPSSSMRIMIGLARRLRDTEQLLRFSTSQNANLIEDEKTSVGQRIADKIAEFSGSLAFLALNAVLFLTWILLNLPGSPVQFDPFPFGFLTMSVSLEAIFLSIFVLISQNRQASKDRIKSDLDYKVNLKAELEIGILMKDMHEIQDRLEIMQMDQARLHSLVRGDGAVLRGHD